MSEQEITFMVKTILEKLGHQSVTADIAGIKKDVHHISRKVDKLQNDFDKHTEWGIVENERNKVNYVTRDELKESFAPIDIIERVAKTEKKIGRIEWFSFVTLMAIVGKLFWDLIVTKI